MQTINYFAVPGLKRQYVNFKIILQKDKVIKAVCDHFKVSKGDLFFGGRYAKFARARYIAFMLLYKYTALNKSEIGELFQKDHTTVVHGIRKINDLIAGNDEIIDDVHKIRGVIISTYQAAF